MGSTSKGGSHMTRNAKVALLMGVVSIITGTGLAFAQMDGPPPPDGPMQGLMHRGGARRGRGAGGRSSGGGAGGRGAGGFGLARFCLESDLNQDGKVTRPEFDAAIAKHFASAAKGKAVLSAVEFNADELARFQDMNTR